MAVSISSFIVAILITTPIYAVDRLRLSTTTSTDNSGLLQVLHPAFTAKYDAKVHVIAVGTGKALKIGSNGDVDVVFAHAPEAELKYVEQGDFINRKPVMYNHFVIVGSTDDLAAVSRAKSVSQALQLIASASADFISRGDDSGTHKKEKSLWLAAGIKPQGSWYIRAGQGMGAVLKMADEKKAYALTDRATYIAYADKLSLTVLFAGDDDALFNRYHIMAVNPAKYGHVNSELAAKYINFVTGTEGQAIINRFRKKGQQLFYGDTNH